MPESPCKRAHEGGGELVDMFSASFRGHFYPQPAQCLCISHTAGRVGKLDRVTLSVHDLWNLVGASAADFREVGPVITPGLSTVARKSLKFFEICKTKALPALQISKNSGLVQTLRVRSQVWDRHGC